MNDNVVFMQFKSPHVSEDAITMSACTNCRNKTFTLTHDKTDDFPMMKCAACGSHLGRMGWAHDDEPPEVVS